MKILTIKTWNQFKDIVAGDEYRSWAFRGQADARWNLEPTLSRYLKNYKVNPSVWSKQELRIYRIFRRKAHQFLDHLPKEEDAFEWLATMQHHGAPTRLLDFTWSPYVAAFFALEQATETSAIWAIYPPVVRREQEFPSFPDLEGNIHDQVGPWRLGNYQKYFVGNEHDFITQGEPYRMNRRLVAQSGTFVIISNIHHSIEEIVGNKKRLGKGIVKFELDTAKIRHELLRRLYNMNITNATLFPDLDGLARSMALEYELHWAYDPKTGEDYDDYYS
ncbi:MAG: FRG domain-containing protein [Bacteroidota bacterium]